RTPCFCVFSLSELYFPVGLHLPYFGVVALCAVPSIAAPNSRSASMTPSARVILRITTSSAAQRGGTSMASPTETGRATSAPPPIPRPERHVLRANARPALEARGGSCGGTLDDRTSNVNVRRNGLAASLRPPSIPPAGTCGRTRRRPRRGGRAPRVRRSGRRAASRSTGGRRRTARRAGAAGGG